VLDYLSENCCAVCKYAASGLSDLWITCECPHVTFVHGPPTKFGTEICEHFERSINYQPDEGSRGIAP